jgi:hypothetical protein
MRFVPRGAAAANGERVWDVFDADTTWLQPLVLEVLRRRPDAGVAAFKPRMVEAVVEVHGCAEELLQGLR